MSLIVSEPLWIQGDSAAVGDYSDGVQEVECDCGWTGEVPTTEEYSMGEVTWYAEWNCPNCREANTNEGWYDPNDDN